MFLHVAGLAGWLGGVLTLSVAPDAPATARAVRRVIWPSLALVVLTGMWSVLVVPRSGDITWSLVLFAKLFAVLVSALGAVLQGRSSSRVLSVTGSVLAVGGALLATGLGIRLSR